MTAEHDAPTRQPTATASAVSSGKKISWPALVLAPRMPVTRPRSLTNQRVATVGPSTLATRPVPSPESRPNNSVSCQISRTRLVASERRPGDREAQQDDVPDADPAHQPAAERPGEAEHDQPDRRGERHRAVDQPGSSVIDRRNAPGAERTPAVTSTTIAVTATTTQP